MFKQLCHLILCKIFSNFFFVHFLFSSTAYLFRNWANQTFYLYWKWLATLNYYSFSSTNEFRSIFFLLSCSLTFVRLCLVLLDCWGCCCCHRRCCRRRRHHCRSRVALSNIIENNAWYRMTNKCWCHRMLPLPLSLSIVWLDRRNAESRSLFWGSCIFYRKIFMTKIVRGMWSDGCVSCSSVSLWAPHWVEPFWVWHTVIGQIWFGRNVKLKIQLRTLSICTISQMLCIHSAWCVCQSATIKILRWLFRLWA